jgi:hypothetical protein
MNTKEHTWLQKNFNAGSGELTDDDINVLIGNPSSSDEDVLAGIAFVQAWLSKKALIPLFQLVIFETRPLAVRQKAAEAIGVICDDNTRKLVVDALSINDLKKDA